MFTHAPRAVLDPRQADRAPTFVNDTFAWAPQETFQKWLTELDRHELKFGVSIQEARGLHGSLEGATVADIGAAYGNNLPAWKSLLGPQGRLVETDVDINAAHFMAYAANKEGYGDRTVVLHTVFEDPCLPEGQFDLVLCSQLHSHITIGPYPRNERNTALFFEQSRAFLGAIRRSLKSDQSQLIVIEGFQPNRDPQQLYFESDDAIRNIEKNGFRLIDKTKNDHVWVASFRKVSH